ncbi:ATPase [Paraburkholderia sp. UYCP14C]|uniref:ATPase n=1 Tax=Paraburkholderia sp. UYCP14C TaxID=2511130 RepID=UPI001021727A|nr:ATPase [Paraburkholderia sp. UYCP14C]RZF26658.1 ATPase [Paraburkholderia sp. UYCP14C]
MSTISEETNTEALSQPSATDIPAAADGPATGADVASASAADQNATTDGADGGEIELELQQMEDAATTLQKEGMISESEAEEKREQVARTRKLFRELSPAERAAIVRRRREIGRELMARQLSGAAVVTATVRLNHTRLKPLFEQWWPYLNRMSINMQRFGRSTFGAEDQGTVTSWLEKQVAELEAYVDEQLGVAKDFREKTEQKLRDQGDIVFAPTVTKPSLAIEVEAYSRFSMRLLSLLMKFDKVMDNFDFLIWNGIRDQSDVDEETARFLRKFHPIGVRGYMTHLRLMTTVRGR